MARTLKRHRFATSFALAAPTGVVLFAACGGYDTLRSDNAGQPDASVAETSTDDVTVDNTAMGVDGADAGPLDTGADVPIAADAGDAGDAARLPDAGDAGDAARLPDAGDAGDAAQLSDADASILLDAAFDARPDTGDAAGVLDVQVDVGPDVDASRLDASDASEASDGDASAFIHDTRLGGATPFAVFAGMTVTNVNATTITGDLGTYPDPTPIGTTMPTLINGTFELGTGVAQLAATDLVTAYNGLTPASMPGCTVLTGLDLGSVGPLPAGIYCFSSSAQLTGMLVLDAGGNPNAQWFFQVGSTLTTASSAVVSVIGGGNQCNVYWQVGSSATLGTGTTFGGNILALASVTLNTGTSVVGRVLGLNGSVTLDTNTVSIATCP